MRRLGLALSLLLVLELLPVTAWAGGSLGFPGGFHGGFQSGFRRGFRSHNVVIFVGSRHPFVHHHFFRPFVGSVFVPAPVVAAPPRRVWVPGFWQWTGFRWVWVPGG